MCSCAVEKRGTSCSMTRMASSRAHPVETLDMRQYCMLCGERWVEVVVKVTNRYTSTVEGRGRHQNDQDCIQQGPSCGELGHKAVLHALQESASVGAATVSSKLSDAARYLSSQLTAWT